jgi:amino acid transporter
MAAPQDYRRHVGPFSATMLIAGSMIGSGIFIVPAEMVRTGGTGAFLLLAWLFTTVLTLLGAHCYGELAGMFPRAGGQYVYLRESYGPLPGFLYGWTVFLIIECGSIAAVAMAQDGLFFPAAAGLNRFGVPGVALALQAVWASLLTLTGNYGQLLEFTMFAALLFYSLTVAGVVVLRWRPSYTWPGLALVALGVPAYVLLRCRERRGGD